MKFNELSVMKQLKLAAAIAGIDNREHPFNAGLNIAIDRNHLETLKKFGITYNAPLVQDHNRLHIVCDEGRNVPHNPWTNNNTTNRVTLTFRMNGDDTLLDLTTNSVDVEVGEVHMDRFGLTSAIKITGDVAESLVNVTAMLSCIEELVDIGPNTNTTLLKLIDGLSKAKEIPEDTLALLGEYSTKRGVMLAVADTLRFENYDYDEDGNVTNLPYVYIEGHASTGIRVVFGNQNSKAGRYSIRIRYNESLGAKEGSLVVESAFNYNTYIKLLEAPISTSTDIDTFIEALKKVVTDASQEDANLEFTKPLYSHFNNMLTEGLPFIKERLKNPSNGRVPF